MAGGAALAGAIWGAFNAHMSNRTQWEQLRATASELRKQLVTVQQAGASEIRLFQRQEVYRRGAVVASFGKSGVAADSGSAFESLITQAGVDGLTKLQIKRNTEQNARNLAVSINFMDWQRKILDRQLWIQLVNGALSGASGDFSSGGGGKVSAGNANTAQQSFGTSFANTGGSGNGNQGNNFNNFGQGSK